jgi:hypothetical protein
MSPKSVICCLAATAFVATTASQASVSSANPTLAESGVQLISMPVHGADVSAPVAWR